MAHVIFLRGINVGGRRRLKPTVLATQLKHLDAISVGSAGTLIVRAPATKTRIGAELARRVPFDADVAICTSADIRRLLANADVPLQPSPPGVVHFVSILVRRPTLLPALPLTLPARGQWMVQVIGRDGRFVFGRHRRHMKAIGHLGALDTLFGVPATTRSVRTIETVARRLAEAPRRRAPLTKQRG